MANLKGTLQFGWFNFFEKKLLKIGVKVGNIKNYHPDLAPIIYCCIQHKRVFPKRRTVVLSEEFKKSKWVSDANWLSLQRKIEAGEDVNGYMSKQLNDWQTIDYLLYTCNITHFHLYKDKSGGIRNELVFGIFTRDCFYVLCVGNHKNIYDANFLVSIASASWPMLDIFKIKKDENIQRAEFDSKKFKRTANDRNLQFNMIRPVLFTDHVGELCELDNHQNTGLINVILNSFDIGKIPTKVYIAYLNEVAYLENLDADLFAIHEAEKMLLNIDEKRGSYVIDVCMRRSLRKTYRISREYITCSQYEEFK